jgi:hypothetical protein
MRAQIRRVVAAAVTAFIVPWSISFGAVPYAVKDRFVLGDPVWKELDVREELAGDYDVCWKRLVDIVIDKGFEIGFMEKDSGYVRTNANTGIVRLKSNWIYEVKVIVKLILDEEQLKAGKRVVDKLRLQVLGGVVQMTKAGILVQSYRGYDRVVLQDLFSDLQLVYGRQ